MTLRYVGPGGADGNTGLSWAQRKLTLNGVEDTPVAAGDTVYVAPGTYREVLTVDIDGAAGQVISYIGDYDGSHTDGVGGVVRITGSNNDQTSTRANCITATSREFRTFRNFLLDTTTGALVALVNCQDTVIDKILGGDRDGGAFVSCSGASQLRVTISNCFTHGYPSTVPIIFSHTAMVDNAAHDVNNCIVIGSQAADNIVFQRVGGCTVRNSLIRQGRYGVAILNGLTAGQTITVNNCVLIHLSIGMLAAALGEITENYNNLYACVTPRTNVGVGAQSLAYTPLNDSRWFFQLVNEGAGPNSHQVVSPWDLASYSLLVNVAGTSPTATDMRGTGTIGAQREWGALEYDATLNIQGGGAVDLPEPFYVGA